MCGLGLAALLGTVSALRAEVYESRAEVRLDPVAIEASFDGEAHDAADDLNAQAAMFEEVVRAQVDAQLAFENDFAVEERAPGSLRFTGRSLSPEYAQAVARTALQTYLAVRPQLAQASINAAVAGANGTIEQLTATRAEAVATGDPATIEAIDADLAAANELLSQAGAAQDQIEGSAQVTQEPTLPSGQAGAPPLRLAATGLLAGLVIGLVVLGLERIGLFSAVARAWRRGLGSAAKALRPVPVLGGSTIPRARARCRAGVASAGAWLLARPLSVIVALALVRALVYALLGVNPINDELGLLATRREFGVARTVPTGRDLLSSRSGAWATFTVVFGGIGEHPLVLFAVVTALNVVAVWLLFLVLRRFFTPGTAFGIVMVWILAPTHNTLVVWPGTTQVVVAIVLLLAGILGLTQGRWLVGGLCLGASILFYELSVAIAFASVTLVASPVLPLRPGIDVRRPLTLASRGLAYIPVVAATVWTVAHSYYPFRLVHPSPSDLWSAHFGLGVLGSSTASVAAIQWMAASVAVAAVVCLVLWATGDRRARSGGPGLVAVGVGVMAAGLWVVFNFEMSVLGLANRLYGVSSIGAAIIVVGIVTTMWRRHQVLASLAAVAFGVVCLMGQMTSFRAFSDAGHDVVRVMDYIDAQPNPDSTDFVIGPTPFLRDGIPGMYSPDGGARDAYYLRYPDGTGSLTVANSADEFVATEGDEVLLTWRQILGEGPG